MVDRCFTTMLDTWLQGETAPSVDQLVSALQMPGVDQRVLALDIDKNKQSEHMIDHVKCSSSESYDKAI